MVGWGGGLKGEGDRLRCSRSEKAQLGPASRGSSQIRRAGQEGSFEAPGGLEPPACAMDAGQCANERPQFGLLAVTQKLPASSYPETAST